MWFLIALFIGGLVLGFAMKPKVQQQKPPGIGEIEAPIAEDGAEIPVLFGTRDLTELIAYGSAMCEQSPIKSGGGGSKK
jgi:hypothetical protein